MLHFIKKLNRKKYKIVFLFLVLVFYNYLPSKLYKDDYSKILLDNKGQLLGAKLSQDEQWRFPLIDSLPDIYTKALCQFEDRRFYYHVGIDPFSIINAAKTNIRAGKIKRGGSTITMQLARLIRQHKKRNFINKLDEAILALRLEIRYSKQEILNLYASHAPFGGNIVGISAAAWRYFGKNLNNLNVTEMVTLAVLPNNPSQIHLGKGRQQLLLKRNNLLDKLCTNGTIKTDNINLFKEEPLPHFIHKLPRLAPHLFEKAIKDAPNKYVFESTIDLALQKSVNLVLNNHYQNLKQNKIFNACAFIIDNETNEIKAYVGNISELGQHHAGFVDIIQKRRSSGSILKPFLYASMLDDGEISPHQLIQDIPTYIQNYHPENFNKKYTGVVGAQNALSRSLNVPFVRLLQSHGVSKFYNKLKQIGLTTLDRKPSNYGLSLILGGAETTLYDVTNTYSAMARTLKHSYILNGQYNIADTKKAHYLQNTKYVDNIKPNPIFFKSSSIYATFEAMSKVERPNERGAWKSFHSSHKMAWKTGTSFRFKDAWAIGVTTKYTIGVWVGNANGQGRKGLIGVRAAAPILFDIDDLLDHAPWFEKPIDDMVQVVLCTKSGYLATEACPKDTTYIPTILYDKPCPYHHTIHLDKTQEYSVNSSCYSVRDMLTKNWFVLPPIEAQYYSAKNPDYSAPPPLMSGCTTIDKNNIMKFEIGKQVKQFSIPRLSLQDTSRLVLSLSHIDKKATVYWYMDQQFIAKTTAPHQCSINPKNGYHLIVCTDDKGHTIRKRIFIK